MVVAIIFASVVVLLIGADKVALARQVADIPNSLPTPVLPSLAVVPALLIPALSLAFVGLVQGAGISASVPNPDSEELRQQESRLILVGVAPSVWRQLERTRMLRSLGRENVFRSHAQIGQGLEEAVDTAEEWIAARSEP
jgi:hypothetical protein